MYENVPISGQALGSPCASQHDVSHNQKDFEALGRSAIFSPQFCGPLPVWTGQSPAGGSVAVGLTPLVLMGKTLVSSAPISITAACSLGSEYSDADLRKVLSIALSAKQSCHRVPSTWNESKCPRRSLTPTVSFAPLWWGCQLAQSRSPSALVVEVRNSGAPPGKHAGGWGCGQSALNPAHQQANLFGVN